VDGVAVGEGAVWVTNRVANTLTRIDLTTQVVAGTIDVGEQPGAVVVGEGSVWVANAIDRTVWRIDPSTMTRTAEISLADTPYDLVLGFGRLWVTSEQAGSVTLIDTSTNTIQRTVTMPGAARGIAAGANEMVIAIGTGDVVLIDPDDPDEFRQISVGAAPYDVAAGEAGVWVSLRE
jgi:YVTN family beta-propeller protein